jgi:hypothetical protein
VTSKAFILGEMALLLGGSLVNEYNTNGGEGWTLGLLSKPVLRKAIAVTGLLALLTFLADVGLGGPAAIFGGLVVLGYLLSLGAGLGESIVALENNVFAG